MKILKPQNIDDLDNEYLKNISDGEKAVYLILKTKIPTALICLRQNLKTADFAML